MTGGEVHHKLLLRIFAFITLAISASGAMAAEPQWREWQPDSLGEARRDGEFFGKERLLELMSAHAGANAAELAELVASEVIEFQRGLPRDDIAVVTLGIPSPSSA